MRQTTSIAQHKLSDEVIICGTAANNLPQHERLDSRRSILRLGLRRSARPRTVIARVVAAAVWSILVVARFARRRVVIVNAHSVAVLPVCALVARLTGASLIYDAHELETETIASTGLQQKIFRRIEALLISQCKVVFVVTESIADWYRHRYRGVDPVIIRNVPDVRVTNDDPPVIDLRRTLEIPVESRLYVHAGNIAAGRNVEAILSAFDSGTITDHLVFLGNGPLQNLVLSYAKTNKRIHLLPPVAPTQLVSVLRTADIGLCLTEQTCLSQRYALPNKLMEYLRAGLPFFHTELRELDQLLSKGIASDNWTLTGSVDQLEAAVLSLSDDEIAGASAAISAFRMPTWEAEARLMLRTYDELVRFR